MTVSVAEAQLRRIVQAEHSDPFSVLGAHPIDLKGKPGIAIRAFLPEAKMVWVVPADGADPVSMRRVEGTDFFEAQFPGQSELFPYRLRLVNRFGQTSEGPDPYSFMPVLSDPDLYLFGEGNNFLSYQMMGAHLITWQGAAGVLFAVWAPNAQRVSVVGDFNGWDGRRHPMRLRPGAGTWELFVPGLGEGTVYKYEIKTGDGHVLLKADPQAFSAEVRPRTASVVWDICKHQWNDTAWVQERSLRDALHSPVSIYEVHLGSWMRVPADNGFLSYRDLAEKLCAYVTQQGFTHVELLPITEFPFDGSWGYQVTGYYAPSSRFGTPDDFQYFVDYLHQHGIGVIMDWVPAHFPKDEYGLSNFDGTALYEYADDRLGEHKAWGTKVFNYGRNEVRQFLISNVLFWLDQYHIDGIRVDAVAAMIYLDFGRDDWVPNLYGGRENLEAMAFLRRLNEKVYELHPGTVTIAEESSDFPGVSRPTYLGGLGFSFKWNMGWMHDTLDYIALDPIYRKYYHQNLTFGLMYAFSENFVLPISHDEVVHLKHAMADKMPGDLWQKMANLRLYYGFMWTHPGKKLLFMGQDFGQWREWSEERSLDWHLLEQEPHRAIQRWVADLNRNYCAERSLWEQDYEWSGFEWIDPNDWEHSILSFIRRAKDPADYLVVVANFTPVVREGYRVGVPELRRYQELLNSDSEYYYGGNVGNGLGLEAERFAWQSQPYSVVMTVPPLAIVILKPGEAVPAGRL
jgi:1,4-alpha-glucan branching enzyme